MNNPYEVSASQQHPKQQLSDCLAPFLNGAQYPMRLTFKFFSFAPTVSLRDATGRQLLYIRQKLFKIKEHVEIFTDETRQVKVADIQANKIIDWSAKYRFVDAQGGLIGIVGRKGLRSLWRAHYEILNPGDETVDYVIREENPWSKVADGCMASIPIVTLFCGYFFSPRYAAKDAAGHVQMRMHKLPAFLEGKFEIQKEGQLTSREELNLLLSFLMMLMLERRRG